MHSMHHHQHDKFLHAKVAAVNIIVVYDTCKSHDSFTKFMLQTDANKAIIIQSVM